MKYSVNTDDIRIGLCDIKLFDVWIGSCQRALSHHCMTRHASTGVACTDKETYGNVIMVIECSLVVVCNVM